MGTFAADVEEHGLLVVVLELVVGPVADQQLEQLQRDIVPVDQGCEVQGRLLHLRLEPVDDGLVGCPQDAFGQLQRSGLMRGYPALMASMKAANCSSGTALVSVMLADINIYKQAAPTRFKLAITLTLGNGSAGTRSQSPARSIAAAPCSLGS